MANKTFVNSFDESYKLLNDAQKEAVDTIDGPLLVIAGPGTGKTQLLSMRVANILRKTDADPSNILCLTFTNKAAHNMQQRILELTAGEAKGVMVKTFHSFAAELMNIYPDYFWNGARLSTAPDATQLDIIQNILAKLPLSNPLSLKFSGNYTAGKDVLKALRYAKEAGLTPEKLEALIKANLAYIEEIEPNLKDILSSTLKFKDLDHLTSQIDKIPNQGLSIKLQPLQDLGDVIKSGLVSAIDKDKSTNKTKHTGKWKQKWLQTIEGQKGMFKERERNNWWLNLSGTYESYRQELHSRGYYDYSDMMVEVITQLQNHPDMRADAQERFQYVLIDEFQDTNAAQLQLAHLIADHLSADGNPNLMAVGDDDQSIYKFNGAELSNILSFTKSYPKTKLVVLSKNYRSTQKVLNVSEVVINQVNDRITNRLPNVVKKLEAVITTDQSDLRHLSFDSEEQQLSFVAQEIADKYKNNKSESIAVLARDHASLRSIAAELHKLDIPISYEQQSNILEQPAVHQIHIIALLLIAINQGATDKINALLSQTLRSPMWQIDPVELWRLASSKNHNWLESLLKSKDEHQQNIAKWLIWLAAESANLPLVQTIEYIIGLKAGEHLTSPLRQYYLNKKEVDTEYLEGLSAVRILRAMVSDFSRQSSPSLEDFVGFINLTLESGQIIADETTFVSGQGAVELLTVHKSKGLEFDTVYILNAIDSSWRPSSGGRKPPANLPLQPAGEDLDDYARLMYVALTRSKQNIIVTSYTQDNVGKDVMPTPLLIEAFEPLKADEIEQSQKSKIEILENSLSWPRLNISDEKLCLKDRLDNFMLSASGLIDFLDISRGGPEYFLERHLLKLPEAKTANLSFGTAIHSALEAAQVATNNSGLVINQVLKIFENALKNENLTEEEYNKYLIHGQELIKKLLKSDTFWLAKGDLPEQNLSDVRINNARIKGVIDRIHITKDESLIIDYKTGQPLSSFTTRDQTKAIKAWRHKTQLIFYAVLLKNSPRFNTLNIKTQMWYVEASAAKELVREYIPSDDEIESMTKLIEVVYNKIINLDLPKIDQYSPDANGIIQFERNLIEKDSA